MGEQSEIEGLLRLGIAAVKAGREDEAHELLSRLLELDPENETGWLWLSAVVPDDDKIVCLENVLTINPSNEVARFGLEALLGRAGQVEEEEEIEVAEREEPLAEVGEEAELEELSAEIGEEAKPEEPSPVEEVAPAEEAAPDQGRSCLRSVALALLTLLTISVCGVAAVLGGILVAGQPEPAVPAATSVPMGPNETSTPAPQLTFPPTFTPTAEPTPVPTRTLVVPDARIPGFPIIREGAYEEVGGRVNQLRELDSLREVETVTFTRYRLEEYLTESYEREEYVAEMEAAEKLYRVLGLIDEDYDLVENEIEILREDIAGLYDSEKEEIYLILDRYTSDLWLEVTFAHEFTHALQDQHFDLDALYDRSPTTDSRLALQTLIEGDATLVMVEYAYEYLFEMSFDRADLLEAIQQVEQGEYGDAPTVVRETSWFPYDQGLVFVAALAEKGGWAQVNQAFANPPESTEQVMHPDKYLAGEVGHPPQVGELTETLGPGWVELTRDVLGELYIRVYLERELGSEQALMAAEGWEGDRGVLLVNDGEDRYVWIHRMSWDSVANADEFLSLYVRFMANAGASSSTLDEEDHKRWESEDQVTYVGQNGQDTLLVLASDSETMELVLPVFPGF
jgi:tetratricopeptide (TPR) repeat protein